jgi:hypothetical protein
VRSSDLGRAHGSRINSAILKEVEHADLIHYGMIPEFVGRLPVIVSLQELTEDELVHVLTEPKNALVKQYGQLFAYSGAKFEVTPGALRAIAQRAMKRGTGTRGLRSIMEGLLTDVMYEVPEYAAAHGNGSASGSGSSSGVGAGATSSSSSGNAGAGAPGREASSSSGSSGGTQAAERVVILDEEGVVSGRGARLLVGGQEVIGGRPGSDHDEPVAAVVQ